MKAEERQPASLSQEHSNSSSFDSEEASGFEMPSIAQPNRINVMAGTYIPEKVWYRNEGNKHIKSRGIG